MVDILPFRGLRYNLEKLAAEGAGLNEVATPPYDVINDAQQDAFYAKHPANFVRVDLNKKSAQDNDTDTPYTRAAQLVEQWEAEQTLIPETQPAIYAYSQSWQENGATIERKGMIALLKLEEFETGKVLPHEHTLKGPKQDRIQLMRSTLCNLSQVFMIYSDPQRTLETLLYSPPNADGWARATDADGVVHQFKPVTDADILKQLQTLFKDKTLLIADGHHRYETGLAYQREVREQIQQQTGQAPPEGSLLSDYGMIFLTNMDDPGLKVYPTHRILYQWPQGWNQERFETELFKKYEVVSADETFSYRKPGTDALIKLRLKPEAKPTKLPPLLDTFDAALLEETVFKGILNTTGEALKHEHLLGFYRNEDEIEALWRDHKTVGGFFLAAPSVKLVHEICEGGNRMPQKSTYFYPKILSGLVLYPYRAFSENTTHALSQVVEAHPLANNTKTPVAGLI
ncbi:DUF1015 domain-containing protein [Vampirovibrio sp.]|uniref:DUF1015 domain-containing protein n=1 Tax=Vampirovibrio sp. TaxID=2717857 RepID=UPI0035938C4B